MVQVGDSILNAINASGFLFQMRVEEEIRRRQSQHNWSVAATEHPWLHEKSHRSGFVDLVLQAGILRAVVECKRTKSATWYFLAPRDAQPVVRGSVVLWMDDIKDQGQRVAWSRLDFTPTTFEAGFCVVRGSGESDQPMLERLASSLVDSTEAVARDEVWHQRGTGRIEQLIYVPVIVTNAKLLLVHCDIPNVNIDTGRINAAEHTEVPFLRFRKALSPRFAGLHRAATLPEVATARQRTVFVVNASGLTTFLKSLEGVAGGRLPWNVASQERMPYSQDLWP
jgi:hypothetical protein